jgi:hypothetical protein
MGDESNAETTADISPLHSGASSSGTTETRAGAVGTRNAATELELSNLEASETRIEFVIRDNQTSTPVVEITETLSRNETVEKQFELPERGVYDVYVSSEGANATRRGWETYADPSGTITVSVRRNGSISLGYIVP